MDVQIRFLGGLEDLLEEEQAAAGGSDLTPL
jgi:hypothetical protein